jgi:hypothetical protein
MNGLFRLATALTEFVWKVIDFFGGALTTGTARSWGEGVGFLQQLNEPWKIKSLHFQLFTTQRSAV